MNMILQQQIIKQQQFKQIYNRNKHVQQLNLSMNQYLLSFITFPFQILFHNFIKKLLHAFSRQSRALVIQTFIFGSFYHCLFMTHFSFLNQILFISYDTYIIFYLHKSIPYVYTFDSSSPSQQSMPLKLQFSVKSKTSMAISASLQYKGIIDLNRSSPAVSQIFNCIYSPVFSFIFFYWYAPARVGSFILVNFPSLYRIVIDVLPTAAFPHNTNLTAFFVVGFESTFGCFYGQFFLVKKHITLLFFTIQLLNMLYLNSHYIQFVIMFLNTYKNEIQNLKYRKNKNRKQQKQMVWYFNFCSPHLTDDSSVNLNRTIMVVQIVLAMLITFIVHMLAQLYDEEASRVKSQADPPQASADKKQGDETAQQMRRNQRNNTGNINDDAISIKSASKTKGNNFVAKTNKSSQPGFFKNKKVFFLTVQTVQNKSPCFFGHFAIAVAACALYSPFIAQTMIGFLYIIAVLGMLVFEAWKFQRMLLISVAVSYISILALITSAVVGVGLTNWDPFTLSCYYTKLGR